MSAPYLQGVPRLNDGRRMVGKTQGYLEQINRKICWNTEEQNHCQCNINKKWGHWSDIAICCHPCNK